MTAATQHLIEARAALFARLASSPTEVWQLSEDEAALVLHSLSPAVVPAEVGATFNQALKDIEANYDDALARLVRGNRFMSQMMFWVSGFFAVMYGASYAASERLTDLLCTAIWSVVIGMHWWTRSRNRAPVSNT